MKKSRAAFTLVELSIVLVILGLLVGGVLAGQSLIRGAELRSITKEKEQYVVALNAFKEKYFVLPGDMANAFQFWGATCGTNTTASGTGCNGDGDGVINPSIAENVKAWEHLSRAGLIEGYYDGVGAVAGGLVTLTTTNTPASKFSGGHWNIGYAPGEALTFATGTLLALGDFDSGSYISQSWITALSSLTLGEAWQIDTKIDDGRSDTGLFSGGHDGACIDSGTDYYSLIAQGASTTAQCIPTFVIYR